ncbi:MAG: HNH endonuclease [Actinomycetota bacterium]
MKTFIAITDNEWFRFLSGLPDLDEVNFWQPSGGRAFRVLQPGEPLLFKLHHPENYLVGGGFFAGHSVLPCSLAWDAFGQKNGVPSFEEMRRRIERYRRSPPEPMEDYDIGCILLEQPFFFERSDWLTPPADFAKNIVTGKTYDLAPPAGSGLWEQIQARLLRAEVNESLDAVDPAMFGDPVLVRPRLGQGSFRVLVTDSYQRRCAVTGEKILPVLQAAHIRPISTGGLHSVNNGLLLRSDVHTLFDRGYVTVESDFRLRVSRRLRNDFDNGKYYLQFDGQPITLPMNPQDQPDTEALEWHSESIFKR